MCTATKENKFLLFRQTCTKIFLHNSWPLALSLKSHELFDESSVQVKQVRSWNSGKWKYNCCESKHRKCDWVQENMYLNWSRTNANLCPEKRPKASFTLRASESFRILPQAVPLGFLYKPVNNTCCWKWLNAMTDHSI